MQRCCSSLSDGGRALSAPRLPWRRTEVSPGLIWPRLAGLGCRVCLSGTTLITRRRRAATRTCAAPTLRLYRRSSTRWAKRELWSTSARERSDGFADAFYGRPEAMLDPEVRRAQSAWSLVSEDDQQRFVDRLSSDLASGAWDAQHGHLRALPQLEGSMRLLIASPS